MENAIIRRKSNVRQQRAGSPAAPSLTPTIQLIIALRDTPLALGLLCFVQRLFLIRQGPVPLSAADVCAADPSLTPSAVRRAMKRLREAGGLIPAGERGAKGAWLPGWGMVAGRPRPWDVSRKMFNRPQHLPAVAFDVRVFDYFLGRLILHERLPALAERYVAAPLLGLRDAGALLLVSAGLKAPGGAVERLERCGLVRAGQPCGLPADGDDILRWISQGQLGAGCGLSDKGLRRLGLAPRPVDSLPAAPGQPLVYLELNHYLQIGQFAGCCAGCCAGHLAGLNAPKTAVENADSSSLGEDNLQVASEPADLTWNLKQKTHETTLPSGGGLSLKKADRPRRTKEPLPTTPTAELLRELGLRPASVRELSHMDFEHVKGVIAYGRSRSDVRSLAGWVVQALRDCRDRGWAPPAPASPNADLFDPQKYAEHGSPLLALLARESAGPSAGALRAAAEPAGPSAEALGAEPAATPLCDQAEPEQLMRWIALSLKRLFRREHSGLIDRLRLIDAGAQPVFSCGAEDLAVWADGLDSYLANLCRDFGWQHRPRFALAEDGAGSGGPAV